MAKLAFSEQQSPPEQSAFAPYNYYHEIVSPSLKHPIMVYNHATGLDYCGKHWHRSFEVCCYINTPLRLWENGMSHQLQEDSLIIINSGDVHEMIPAENKNPHGVSLIFPYEFLLLNDIDVQTMRFLYTAGEPYDSQLRQSLHHISALLEANEPYAHLLTNAEIFQVLHLLVTHYRFNGSGSSGMSDFHLDRCKRILSYVDENFVQEITLESLGECMGLSVGYLSRYFQKYLGVSFKTHLTSVRLQHALAYMKQGDQTMLQLAMECGFPDYRSFIAAFRRWYHVTPYQYLLDSKNQSCPPRPELVFAQHIPAHQQKSAK